MSYHSFQNEKDISDLAYNCKRIADSLEEIVRCLSVNINR